MKFFVDSADLNAIAELNDIGLVDGVTTNPSIIAKSGRDFKEVIKEICKITEGHVSAEVVAMEADKMIEEGRTLRKIAPNVCVKLPLTMDLFMIIMGLRLKFSPPLSVMPITSKNARLSVLML